jgi:alkyldihydroxyacetonephosphate synthase
MTHTTGDPSRARLEALRSRLIEVLGEAHISCRRLDRLAYGHDAWPVALKAAATPRWQPDLVAWPGSTEQVAAVVRIAAEWHVPVVPVGGGSGIVGGALAVRGGIALDLLRMGRVIEIDEVSGLVRVEAGAIGANLERTLAARGLTTGHLPQSIRSSTIGGWIAHRAAGIASTKYGKIESILRAVRVVLADGRVLDTLPAPASASGPMLHAFFLGAEGTLGIVTEAVLAVESLPAERRWASYGFAVDAFGPEAAFVRALEVVRRVVRRGYRPAILRAYDPAEALGILEQAGRTLTASPRGCAVLIVGAEGEAPLVDAELAALAEEAAAQGAVALGPDPAMAWYEHRFDTSRVLEAVRRSGWIGDALEVAAPWRALPEVYRATRSAMVNACGPDGAVFGHLSHAYPDGGNLYLVFWTRGDADDEMSERYHAVLDAALGACLASGGTVSHHHGIGLAKQRWLGRELGAVGLDLLRRQKAALDPLYILNPGKLGDVT